MSECYDDGMRSHDSPRFILGVMWGFSDLLGCVVGIVDHEEQ